MAKKSEMLKDKLNALKPSIPTNTRGEVESQPVRETELKKKPMPAKSPKKEQPKVKINIHLETPDKKEESSPGPVSASQENRREDKLFIFESAFIFPELVQENIASFNRIRDLVIEETNNLNNFYLQSCWKGVGICYEAIRKTCFAPFPPPFPIGKWPFKF